MVRPPYGRRPAAAALALAATLHGIAAFGAEDPIVLLDFWSPTCGPCMQMKPTVESLIRANYPIRQVDVSREVELARQYNVTGVPCFIMLVNGREVHRVRGTTSSERLQQMFTFAKETLARQLAEERERNRGQSPNDSPAPRPPEPAPADEAALPEQVNSKLLSSTVRFTVEHGRIISHGTGTIIDARQGEALIITCAHLFRETKGQGPVEVELFEAGPQGVRVVEKLQGHVICYDLEREVAFVSIRAKHPVCVAQVAPSRTQVAKGDLAASVGCSNGQDPTVMPTRITWLDRYQGPPNIEASGAPAIGRSGGGLFNEQGQLVGVCYAADEEGNRGLYAGLKSIHEELDRLELRDIYAEPGVPGALKTAGDAIAPPVTDPLVVRGQELRGTDPPQTGAATPPATTIAIAPQGSPGPVPENLSAIEQAAFEEILKRATKRNVVCIVQPESPGGEVEVITLENVSDEFVRGLAERQKAAAATRSAFKPLQPLQTAQTSISAFKSWSSTDVDFGCLGTIHQRAAVGTMVWYVAVIAVVNIALGYALARMLGSNKGRIALAGGEAVDAGNAAEF